MITMPTTLQTAGTQLEKNYRIYLLTCKNWYKKFMPLALVGI